MWSDPEPGYKNSHMFNVIDKISKYLFAKKEVAFLVREVPQGLSSNHEGCVNATFGDIKYKFVFCIGIYINGISGNGKLSNDYCSADGKMFPRNKANTTFLPLANQDELTLIVHEKIL